MASTHLGLLKALQHNMAAEHRHQHAVKQSKNQLENTPSVLPLVITMHLFQEYETINSIEHIYPDSFDKIDSVPKKDIITLDPNV